MNSASNQPDLQRSFRENAGGPSPATPNRLQLIHHLVRSGDYHVPAAEVAERMIEQLLIARQEYDS